MEEATLEGQEVAVLLGGVPERVTDLVSGLDGRRLQHRHAPALPSLDQLVAHLCAEGTAVDGLLRRAILDGGRDCSLRAVMDPGRLAEADRPLPELLAGFARVRRRTVDLLFGLSATDWAARISDREAGELSLLEVGSLIARHEIGHVSQIRNLIALLPEP